MTQRLHGRLLFLNLPRAEMLPCLRRVLRPALALRAGAGMTRAGVNSQPVSAMALPLSHHLQHHHQQRRNLGTHPLKEHVEPLNSPRGAKDFIYSLHPSERTCLLRELHRFESIAIAQGRTQPPAHSWRKRNKTMLRASVYSLVYWKIHLDINMF